MTATYGERHMAFVAFIRELYKEFPVKELDVTESSFTREQVREFRTHALNALGVGARVEGVVFLNAAGLPMERVFAMEKLIYGDIPR